MPETPEIQWVRRPTRLEKVAVMALVVERRTPASIECCSRTEKPGHIVVWLEDCDSDFIAHVYCAGCYDFLWAKGAPGPLFAVAHLPADEEREQ